MHELSSTKERRSAQEAREAARAAHLLITWLPPVAVAAAIFWASSRSSLGEPNLIRKLLESLFGGITWNRFFAEAVILLDTVSSWLAHLAEYFVLCLAFIWAVRRQWPDLAYAWLAAYAFTAFFALTDEYHQSFVPGRHSDVRDLFTDWIGAGLAVAVVLLWTRKKYRGVWL